MYQSASVCQCDIQRHWVDDAQQVKYATGKTRGVCTKCFEFIHVEDAEHPPITQGERAEQR
jgi:hypothetical protein